MSSPAASRNTVAGGSDKTTEAPTKAPRKGQTAHSEHANSEHAAHDDPSTHFAPAHFEPAHSMRRRGAMLEDAIFAAVLEQMSTVGFAALTMEGVAHCAHTGKSALYRRWPNKEDLVADALDRLLPSFDPPPDSGSLRADITHVLASIAATMNSPTGCALQSLMGELDHDHEFVRTVHTKVLAPRKAVMLDILRRGAERGAVRPDAVNSLVADVGTALLVNRLLTVGPPVDDAFVTEVVDRIVLPLVQTDAARPESAAPGSVAPETVRPGAIRARS